MTLFYALIALGSLALVFGLILGFAAIRFRVESNPIVDQIDTILPQTQCAPFRPSCAPATALPGAAPLRQSAAASKRLFRHVPARLCTALVVPRHESSPAGPKMPLSVTTTI